MLHVYHSNRLEALFVLLCSIRESQPLADPLAAETILVANPGIGRWLNFQIADRAGIAANIDYVLPATFVWRLYRDCLENVPEQSAFERTSLRMRVLKELDAIDAVAGSLWAPLQRYAADTGEVGDTKRVQLASRIADVFDQYLVYRPQLLLDWERGANNIPGDDSAQRWQPALWRRLVESTDEPHRAALWHQFCALADKGELDPNTLPPRLHLFNVGLLPPSTLDVLVRLARMDDDSDRVSMYFLNPAIDYWADLLDMRRAARERLKLADTTEPLADDQIGNPLLSSLGGSGRTLMKLLGDRSEWVHDEQFFLPAATDSLLAAVQRDLLHPFDNTDSSGDAEAATPADTSIQLHQCYSPMREVQALHDHLLDRFNADASLTPADVIVMVPDINRYAPVIEAVFGSIGGESDNPSRTRYVPWSIADRALVQVSQVVGCVQRLFELPAFEFEANGVLAFASVPAIARRFGFDDSALKTLAQWLCDAGIRRTLAGEHPQLLQQPEPVLHSWDFGLRRLLLARAMPPDSGAVGATLPCNSIHGQQAELLSQLLNLLQALSETRTRLGGAHSVAAWVDIIGDIINRFLRPDEEEADALSQLRELLTALDADAVRAGLTDVVSHATFGEMLRDNLAGAQQKNHRYLTGRITFSSMVPLRSVPFRLVCMMGMNDGDFPRQRPVPGFDLIAQKPQPGDRSVRDDDRYLFLEALLSARDELYLSWIYHDSTDNATREPSVLVSELRDYLSLRHSHTPPCCIEHPLQPFSRRLFDPAQSALHSFASEWEPPQQMPAAVQLTDTQNQATPDAQIALADLQRFWRHPCDWYCRRVLGVALWRDEQEPEDAEPFALDALSSYQLRSDLIDAQLLYPDLDRQAVHDRINRSGALPHGGLGVLSFDTVYEEAAELIDRIHALQIIPEPAFDIDIVLCDQQIQGRLQEGISWPDGTIGLLHHHASKLSGSHVSAWWLAHLIGSAAGVLTGTSILICKDSERILAALAPADARLKLQPWIEGWNQGQSTAIPFFSKTSAVLAGAVKGNVKGVWQPSDFGAPGEREHEAVQLLYSDIINVTDHPVVIDWATRLLGDEVLRP